MRLITIAIIIVVGLLVFSMAGGWMADATTPPVTGEGYTVGGTPLTARAYMQVQLLDSNGGIIKLGSPLAVFFSGHPAPIDSVKAIVKVDVSDDALKTGFNVWLVGRGEYKPGKDNGGGDIGLPAPPPRPGQPIILPNSIVDVPKGYTVIAKYSGYIVDGHGKAEVKIPIDQLLRTMNLPTDAKDGKAVITLYTVIAIDGTDIVMTTGKITFELNYADGTVGGLATG